MKVFVAKDEMSGFYYAWDGYLLGSRLAHIPDFKWQKWKELQLQWDALQKDMKSVFEGAEP